LAREERRGDLHGRVRRQEPFVVGIGKQKLLHETWFGTFAHFFAALFVYVRQLLQMKVDIACKTRGCLRVEPLHNASFTARPIGRLKCVVYFSNNFVHECLARIA